MRPLIVLWLCIMLGGASSARGQALDAGAPPPPPPPAAVPIVPSAAELAGARAPSAPVPPLWHKITQIAIVMAGAVGLYLARQYGPDPCKTPPLGF